MVLHMLLAEFNIWSLHLPTPVALAAVTVIGYLVGRRRRLLQDANESQARRELKRAAGGRARAGEDRRSDPPASGHAPCQRRAIQESSRNARHREPDGAWQELCQEAEGMLKPTFKLAAQLANAYDEIRQQSNHLMTFTEVAHRSADGSEQSPGARRNARVTVCDDEPLRAPVLRGDFRYRPFQEDQRRSGASLRRQHFEVGGKAAGRQRSRH